jgi:hypothetical protein
VTLLSENNIDDEVEIGSKNPKINAQLNQMEVQQEKQIINLSEYNFETQEHIPKKYISVDGVFNTLMTDEELKNLAMNAQNNIAKVRKINQIAKYYINADDIVGKIHETLENNINPTIKLNFPIVDGRNKQKVKQLAEDLISRFNKSINVKKLLRKGIPLTYDEGNFNMYLRDINGNYKVDIFPLGIYEVSDYMVDDENICVINIGELVSKISETGLANASGKKLFEKPIADEIKQNYPKEVYEAYVKKQVYAKLDITRTGHVTVNRLNGRYGLTPIFKAFKPLKTAEIYDKTNVSNAKTKAKKILIQILSDKMLGQDGQAEFDVEKWQFAHSNFVESYKASSNADLVFVTLPSWVSDVKYVEPKVEDINIDIVNQQRNKILSALGISFLSNESKSSFNTVEINVKELLKTIDKISEGFAEVLTKWYSLVFIQNNIPLEYLPEVQIESSSMLETELKIKLCDILYSKIGVSYRTTLETLGLNFEEERQRRESENKENMDEIFTPHASSYTSNSNDLLNNGTGKNSDETQNEDKDKSNNDVERYKTQL